MHSKLLVAASLSALANNAIVSAADSERILGVYVFHRHGDRTAKAWSPVNLTALGADEVHSSGAFYRSRYVSSNADFRVAGLSSETAVLSQLEVTAPRSRRLSMAISTSPLTPSAMPPPATRPRATPGSRAAADAAMPSSAPTTTSPRPTTSRRTTTPRAFTKVCCPSSTAPTAQTPPTSRMATRVCHPATWPELPRPVKCYCYTYLPCLRSLRLDQRRHHP